MKRLVIYDSVYGNTAELARAIASALDEAEAITVDQADLSTLGKLDLVVLGSPTQGGRPTPKMKALLSALPANALRGTKVAAFDTRVSLADHGFALRLLIQFVGCAAPRMARKLAAKGGELVAKPEGFIVEGREGPLRAGELDRARAWAQVLLQGRQAVR